ncbi:MAG TPA: glycosyltransferase family 4 protein [Candidatus Polarisedimenticolia bacterium]|nr:glycosyltransferase family 4 protein [Candidatus Polarisedimenticolia bacterium]
MPRPVHVCHVITLLELGGAQENTLYTVSHLGERFRPSLVAGPGGLLDDDARKLGLPIHFVPSLKRRVSLVLDLAALAALVRIFRRERPDIVHTHSSKAGILGRLAARLARVPRVVHTIHGYGFNATRTVLARGTFIALERLASRLTDRLIAVSRANIEQGVALGLFAPERVTLIRSGVPLAAFEAAARSTSRGGRDGLRRELGLPEDAPLVGMIACLKPQKAPLTFLEVAARVLRDIPGATFLVAGDGELRADVERRAAELGLNGHLRLLGWRRDVPEVMASLDVLLHTSLWEGLPRVLPEAIASGVPIVATSVDGTSEILRDGRTGIVRSPGDVEGLAAGVARLLHDRSYARALTERARSILAEFDIDAMVRDQERLYLELMEEGRSEPGASSQRPTPINNDERSGAVGRGSFASDAPFITSC